MMGCQKKNAISLRLKAFMSFKLNKLVNRQQLHQRLPSFEKMEKSETTTTYIHSTNHSKSHISWLKLQYDVNEDVKHRTKGKFCHNQQTNKQTK